MNTLDYYNRQKDAWDAKEIEDLISEYNIKQMTISQIADNHYRTPGVISYKLKNLGIQVIIASTETNKVVLARGNKMGVDVLQGLSDKAKSIEQYIEKMNLSWDDVWYIGNDVNDIQAIKKAKVSICPSDAVRAVKKEVDIKLKTRGGYGVLSELASLLES